MQVEKNNVNVFQATVFNAPRTSGRQRKKMDYKAMNEGLEFIETPGTKLKTSRNPTSSVAASMASSSGVLTPGSPSVASSSRAPVLGAQPSPT